MKTRILNENEREQFKAFLKKRKTTLKDFAYDTRTSYGIVKDVYMGKLPITNTMIHKFAKKGFKLDEITQATETQTETKSDKQIDPFKLKFEKKVKDMIAKKLLYDCESFDSEMERDRKTQLMIHRKRLIARCEQKINRDYLDYPEKTMCYVKTCIRVINEYFNELESLYEK